MVSRGCVWPSGAGFNAAVAEPSLRIFHALDHRLLALTSPHAASRSCWPHRGPDSRPCLSVMDKPSFSCVSVASAGGNVTRSNGARSRGIRKITRAG